MSLSSLEFELELKGFTGAHARSVVGAVRAHDAMARTEFTSWHYPLLLALKSEHPDARLGLFSRRREPWMPDSVFEQLLLSPTEFGAFDVVHVYAADVSPQLVTKIHERGLVAHANDAVGREEVERAVQAGVDRVSSNDVATAVRVTGGS